MTPKQAERIKTKIKRIKAELAADKKRWGGYYDDSRGLRYMPPRFYIQLGNYTGGLRYMNWFKKNFPNDSGFPVFLFEWTIILFKTGRLKEVAHKVFETFCRNTYFFDKFWILFTKFVVNKVQLPPYEIINGADQVVIPDDTTKCFLSLEFFSFVKVAGCFSGNVHGMFVTNQGLGHP